MKRIERTFVAIKPDAVKRYLIGELITRFEKKGYKITAMKMVHPDRALAEKHYEEHKDKPFFEDLVDFLTCGPIVAMVVEGLSAIGGCRHIIGATDPDNASPGTIRADYAQILESNIIHGSDSEESAEREISIYFNEDEIHSNWEIVSERINLKELRKRNLLEDNNVRIL